MGPPVFAVFISVLQLAAIVNAFFRSVSERFTLGIVGALVRAGLLAAGAIAAVLVRSVRYPGSDVPVPSVPGLFVLVGTVLGPMVSFFVLWMAYRRKADAPAAQEERASRPFGAWLPVALFDGAFVAINVFALLMSRER